MVFGNLIAVRDLAAIIDAPNTIVVDCRFDLANPAAGREQYQSGHLPGALYVHLDEQLSSPITPTTGRHPLPVAATLASQFGEWGIAADSQIVAYDNSGGAFASRFWWLARWLGHDRVAVLDGGITAWQAAGHALTTDLPNASPTTFVAHIDDSLWVTSESVAERLDAIQLIDAREAERFRGEVEPIDPVAGHIPSAINLPFKANLDNSGYFLAKEKLSERFAPLLESSTELPIVAMCGSGVTACHNLLAMHVAGIDNAKLYAGSWSEWIRDRRRAVESVSS